MMPSYETLDLIADAFNPFLLLCIFILAAYDCFKTQLKLRCGLHAAIALLIVLVLVYGMLALDNHLSIWPRLGLDYSTHTAFAAGMCFLLWRRSRGISRYAWPVSLLVYCALMRYQQYHTWSDMITTLAYMVLAIMLTVKVSNKMLVKM